MNSMPNRLNSIAAFIPAFRGRQRWLKRITFGFIVAWAILPTVVGRRVIIINTSPSVAPGLYLRSSQQPAVGKLVDFCIPPAARTYVLGRTGHRGDDWYILKPIVAGPGDRIDTSGDWLVVNDRRIAPMPPPRDSRGRPLPRWRDHRILGSDEFFVFSDRIPNSFDSRCYGPVKRNEIASVRSPLIVW
jgi:conjugative transfer signal peptidase TraF